MLKANGESNIHQRFTAEFIGEFCFPDGSIDWEKLVRLVSEDKQK